MQTDEALEVRDAAVLRASQHASRPSPEDVEDIAQEVVLRYARQPAGSIERPAAWANTVAGNLCVTYARRRGRGAPLPEGADDEQAALESFVTRGKPTSYGAMIRQQTESILASLTPRERELIQLVAEGTPQSDVAVALGYASADSVKVTLNRLRRKVLAATSSDVADWQDHPRVY